jgi:membrane protein implicated in regulation of membrane protease activity
MSNLWYIWLIIAAVFAVAEVFTSGFVLLWFGVGALVAGILALTGLANLPLQIVIFLGVSTLLTILSRTIFEKVFMRSSPGRELKTGIESLPGQVGIVVEGSSGALKEGAVRVFGSTWRAYPCDNEEVLVEGEQVQVERIDGVSVFVRKVRPDASWRRL